MSDHSTAEWGGPEGKSSIFSGGINLGSGGSFFSPFADPAENPPEPAEKQTPAESQTRPAQPEAEPETNSKLIPIQTPQSQEPEELPENPLKAAEQEQRLEQARRKLEELRQKPPMLVYGSVQEAVEQPERTFEELRQELSEDFPELGNAGLVSWSVQYGNQTVSISRPAKETVSEAKKAIEDSPDFLESLTEPKKGKGKQPDFICKVKPFKKMETKGRMSRVYLYPPEGETASPIRIVPARDGRVYRISDTRAGQFITPSGPVPELAELRPGFWPKLPLIPLSLLCQVIAFFRQVMAGSDDKPEALAHILYDLEEERYVVRIPRQRVSRISVEAEGSPEEERYLRYLDIHSHNTMPARFSPTDDKDELSTRLYGVAGRLDQFYPELSLRLSNGGVFHLVSPFQVFQGPSQAFPEEWLSCVKESDGRLAA